jgi:hypothetical protein
MRRSPGDTRPEYRQLRIYAIDPMVARAGEHQATVQIRYEEIELRGGTQDSDDKPLRVSAIEDLLRRGAKDFNGKPLTLPVSFAGSRLEVVDVDASGSVPVWLKPVNLDDPNIAMQLGLEPAESDPQFHQQMVYAVAMRTLEQFDRAFGRVLYFTGRRRLRLVPHAFRGGNAFYHPKLRAILFGYFRASRDAPGENLPGQVIFTCLSHDIIAHEVTHAVVDRLRPYFSVATNPHVRAFHEGFADIVAVFQRLSFRDLVQRELQNAGADIRKSQLLFNIAAQFGQGLGSGKALRTALDSKTKIQDVTEEHALGAVLVAALLEAFLASFDSRSADLVRIATGGTGILPPGNLHPDLVRRLTAECIRIAQSVLTMCIRAFDYLPPADVTFGSFLRALVTADWEVNPLDELGLRASVSEACRRRGIFAAEAGSLAVNALLLDVASDEEWKKHEARFRKWVDLAIAFDIDEQRALTPDDGYDVYLPDAPLQSNRPFAQQAPPVRSDYSDTTTQDDLPAAIELANDIIAWFAALLPQDRQRLGLRPDPSLQRPHFHSNRRVTSDGTVRFGLVVQLVQIELLDIGGTLRKFPSGLTLVIDVTGKVRFVISSTPYSSRTQDLETMAAAATTNALGWPVDDPLADPFAVDYHGMHEARS